MRNKLQNYFIGKYLNHPDVFEQARAKMLYHFSLAFFLIFLLPVSADISFGLHKATLMHSIDALSLLTLPFTIRYVRKLDSAINYFFTVVIISSLAATMMLNPVHMHTIFVAWIMFFIILSALLQRGTARMLYCFFFGWVPIFYVLLNAQLQGALTWDWIVQPGAEQPPVFLIFIPMVLGIYAIWNHTSTIDHAKGTITRQKQVIEEKNTAITDSITYAKRIQQAKLPKKEEISSSLPQSFVLFKPKDIVSGDFYFYHLTPNPSPPGEGNTESGGEVVFIAAADCTGHGVPGALMSMVCSEKLQDAVSQNSDPSAILKQLNKGVRTSLRQSDSSESTRDGMDIALCSIDPVTFSINYAGANRPLWIIRSGQATLEEIKATKKAIGGFTDEEQHFESHRIQLKKGDTLYICTDGYADQFGGKTGKKLMTRTLKNILLSIQDKTMQEQEKYLDSFVENWKAGTEQVDDILVIGVRM